MMIKRVELESERCLLRPFTHKDVDDTLEYATSPGWAQFLPGVPQPYLPIHAEEFVARAITSSWEQDPMLAVVYRAQGKVIGSIAVRMQPEHKRAEIGYSLSSHYWGQGLMPEAIRGVLGWAFGTCELEKVFAVIQPTNIPSRRVAEKVGMTLEGTLRKHDFLRGERSDMSIYGLLKEEWRRI